MQAQYQPSWGNAGAYSALETLTIYDVGLAGTLPFEWGSNSSLPAIKTLIFGTGRLDFSCLSGTLSAE